MSLLPLAGRVSGLDPRRHSLHALPLHLVRLNRDDSAPRLRPASFLEHPRKRRQSRRHRHALQHHGTLLSGRRPLPIESRIPDGSYGRAAT